jgi:aldose 1-epimerase
MDTVRLTCNESAASADILPGRGGACAAATLVRDGVPRRVVWAPPGYATATTPSFLGGIAILCPFAGRLPREPFEFRGRRYRLPLTDGYTSPIHGLVHDRPWRVIDQAADRVVLEFRLSQDAADRRVAWPADFRLTATWSLEPHALTVHLSLAADGPMPAALGLHPYLPVPIVPGGDPRGCLVDLPARSWQTIDADGGCGPRLPAAAKLAFPGAVPLGDLAIDDVFVDLAAAGGRVNARLIDPAGAAIAVEFDDVFSACVIYTPRHREAVCIEPWTIVPGGPPDETARGWSLLDASETLSAAMTISLTGADWSADWSSVHQATRAD